MAQNSIGNLAKKRKMGNNTSSVYVQENVQLFYGKRKKASVGREFTLESVEDDVPVMKLGTLRDRKEFKSTLESLFTRDTDSVVHTSIARRSHPLWSAVADAARSGLISSPYRMNGATAIRIPEDSKFQIYEFGLRGAVRGTGSSLIPAASAMGTPQTWNELSNRWQVNMQLQSKQASNPVTTGALIPRPNSPFVVVIGAGQWIMTRRSTKEPKHLTVYHLEPGKAYAVRPDGSTYRLIQTMAFSEVLLTLVAQDLPPTKMGNLLHEKAEKLYNEFRAKGTIDTGEKPYALILESFASNTGFPIVPSNPSFRDLVKSHRQAMWFKNPKSVQDLVSYFRPYASSESQLMHFVERAVVDIGVGKYEHMDIIKDRLDTLHTHNAFWDHTIHVMHTLPNSWPQFNSFGQYLGGVQPNGLTKAEMQRATLEAILMRHRHRLSYPIGRFKSMMDRFNGYLPGSANRQWPFATNDALAEFDIKWSPQEQLRFHADYWVMVECAGAIEAGRIDSLMVYSHLFDGLLPEEYSILLYDIHVDYRSRMPGGSAANTMPFPTVTYGNVFRKNDKLIIHKQSKQPWFNVVRKRALKAIPGMNLQGVPPVPSEIYNYAVTFQTVEFKTVELQWKSEQDAILKMYDLAGLPTDYVRKRPRVESKRPVVAESKRSVELPDEIGRESKQPMPSVPSSTVPADEQKMPRSTSPDTRLPDAVAPEPSSSTIPELPLSDLSQPGDPRGSQESLAADSLWESVAEQGLVDLGEEVEELANFWVQVPDFRKADTGTAVANVFAAHTDGKFEMSLAVNQYRVWTKDNKKILTPYVSRSQWCDKSPYLQKSVIYTSSKAVAHALKNIPGSILFTHDPVKGVGT